MHPNIGKPQAAASNNVRCIEMETMFHGLYRVPRDLKEMMHGLDQIINNYIDYRYSSLNTAQKLSWLNRSKELIQLYERHTN